MGNHLNRRNLLVGSAAATVLGVVTDTAQTREINGQRPWLPRQADSPEPDVSQNYVYFTPVEIAFVEAASERIIPADDLGPGAKACGVAIFIDHQLNGEYGRAGTWYMQGPWAKGEDTQGFQSRLAPADMYRAAIKAINAYVSSKSTGKTFAEIGPDEQDSLLSQMENGKIALEGVDAASFFKILLQNTKEGMFSDPIYGGNKEMAGWKMLGFPGARYDYREWVGRHGERYDQPPVGLRGRPAWTQQG